MCFVGSHMSIKYSSMQRYGIHKVHYMLDNVHKLRLM